MSTFVIRIKKIAYLRFCKTVQIKLREFPCYLFLKKILVLLLLSVIIIFKTLLDNRLLKTVTKLKT